MFSAFTPLAGGTLDTYYRDNEYPYDLNGALDFTRPQLTWSPMPYPQLIGAVSGLLALTSIADMAPMLTGKIPTGTWVGSVPDQSVLKNFVFPNMQGGLRKVTG